MLAGANVLLVANRYDEITAMTLQGTAQSEVKASGTSGAPEGI